MRRKSRFSRVISIIIFIAFVVVGFNIGRGIFGDNAKSRLTDVTNLLVAGVDIDGYRTDLILFVQVDNINGRVSVLQVPRDTRVENNRRDKKINSAYFSGIDTLNKELSSIIGMKADFFATITFDAFCDIVDALGGVMIDVPIDMNYHDPVQGLTIELEKGRQKLDGEHAMMFMRFRKNDDGTGYARGDVDRNAAQKDFYSAVMKKAMSPIGIIKAPVLYSTIMKNTTTDLNNAEVRELMMDVFKIGKSNISIYQVPGEGKYIGGVSYFIHDKKATKELMSEHFYAK